VTGRNRRFPADDDDDDDAASRCRDDRVELRSARGDRRLIAMPVALVGNEMVSIPCTMLVSNASGWGCAVWGEVERELETHRFALGDGRICICKKTSRDCEKSFLINLDLAWLTT
jgi:hypothetical protein